MSLSPPWDLVFCLSQQEDPRLPPPRAAAPAAPVPLRCGGSAVGPEKSFSWSKMFQFLLVEYFPPRRQKNPRVPSVLLRRRTLCCAVELLCALLSDDETCGEGGVGRVDRSAGFPLTPACEIRASPLEPHQLLVLPGRRGWRSLAAAWPGLGAGWKERRQSRGAPVSAPITVALRTGFAPQSAPL